jgi:hypothetical protein
MYTDFDYYTDTYKGTLITEEAEFDLLAEKESRYLDISTFYKLADEDVQDSLSEADLDKINYCICELVDKQKNYNDKIANVNTVGIKSESVDGYSITYITEQEKKEMELKLDIDKKKIIRERLALTFLLFRG